MRMSNFFSLKNISFFVLMTSITLTRSGSLSLNDIEDDQVLSCVGSLLDWCQIQFIPASSFYGTIEVSYQTQAENLDPTQKQKLSALLCMNGAQICDFNGQYMSLRNLSLEGQFNKDQVYTFTLQPQSTTLQTLITTYTVNKGSNCVNKDCGGNGSCFFVNNKKQCSCDNQYGAKNCEASVESSHPNYQYSLSIPSTSYRIIQFAFSSIAKDVLKDNQVDLILSSPYSQLLNIYILDGTSQKSSGGYKQEYKQTINDQISMNKLFSTSTDDNNFILLIIIFNENTAEQSIKVELKVYDTTSTSSDGDSYFIYFLIGMIGLIVLIIISGFVYFIFRRRLLRERAANNLNMLAQALIQNPIDTKETESLEKYSKIFNDAIPSHKMSAATLKDITAQNNNNNNKDLNQSEIQNGNGCICSICLQPIQVGEKYRQTICKHLFHVECIDVWIQKQRNCPMCRASHKTIDLQKYLKQKKSHTVTEIHQINGKSLQFEMFDNPAFSPSKRSGSSPLGFIPILPHSLTRPQQSQSIIQQFQELSSPQKAQQSPQKGLQSHQKELQSPQKGLQSPQKIPFALNDSSQVQISIPDNSNDLINFQLPLSSLNESSIAGIAQNNINNSCNLKKINEEQNNTLTKIVDIMNNNNNNNSSSILGSVSSFLNGKIKGSNSQNLQYILRPIVEEENNNNSIHSTQIHRSSQYNIFTDQAQKKTETDLEKGMRGTSTTQQFEMTSQMTESSNRHGSPLSGIKLNYNYELQQKAQSQYLKTQIFAQNQIKNTFLYKSRLTQ